MTERIHLPRRRYYLSLRTALCVPCVTGYDGTAVAAAPSRVFLSMTTCRACIFIGAVFVAMLEKPLFIAFRLPYRQAAAAFVL